VFALKKLKGIGESNREKTADFLRETNALSRVSGTHLHFISLLATWSYRGEHCLLFPFADGDLRDYWENMSHAIDWQGSREAIIETVRWMSSQILGLTDALNALHSPVDQRNGLYGRHGDIKPENILIFAKGREDRGLLVFTDFASAEFHTAHSRSAGKASEMIITPTYRPPEYDMENGIASRSSDIWSFGCLLLEFVCWAIGGDILLKEFTECRLSEYITGMLTDNFFELLYREGGKLVVRVKLLISQVRILFIDELLVRASRHPADTFQFVQERLHGHPCCTRYLHNLLDVIENDMLVVLSPHTERLSSSRILAKFQQMHARAVDDSTYCEHPCPSNNTWKAKATVEADIHHIIARRAAANNNIHPKSRQMRLDIRETSVLTMPSTGEKDPSYETQHEARMKNLFLTDESAPVLHNLSRLSPAGYGEPDSTRSSPPSSDISSISHIGAQFTNSEHTNWYPQLFTNKHPTVGGLASRSVCSVPSDILVLTDEYIVLRSC
jgi:serine/threonine protein kinase